MSSSQSVPSLYVYNPNKVAPIVFAVLFTVSTLWHLWQCIHCKCFKVTGLYAFTAILFAAGFATREYGAFNVGDVNVYFVSTLLIYFAPPLLELANYTILGRVLYYVPYLTPLHPGRVLTTFGTVSVLVEALNGIAVSYLTQAATPNSSMHTGSMIMKIALVLQLCVITIFCLLAALFWYRCAKHGITSRNVVIPLVTLYMSMGLILIRTIYRCVEYFGSQDLQTGLLTDPSSISPLLRHEWFFYVFEATIMLLNSYLWNILHPRRFLPEKNNMYLAQDGVTERKGPEWKDARPILLKIMDPVGFTTMFGEFAQKDHMKERYWEMETVNGGNNENRVGMLSGGDENGNEERNKGRGGRVVGEELRRGDSIEIRRL